ncbi:MAG: hydrogenase maturation protease [Gammaproteobacteria bacterium]|nr:hydrogenase maturation protease [Gammaproteobacteria bacterium]
MTADALLIFAYGNVSRGDDALAPLLLERLQQQGIQHGCGLTLQYLTDYQMHIEHVMDMQQCRRVLLIDAAQDTAQALRFYPVTAQAQTLYTTHGMSPSTLLHTYQQVLHEEPPATAMLAITGYQFELGEGLSPQAEANLDQAEDFVKSLLDAEDFSRWDARLASD